MVKKEKPTGYGLYVPPGGWMGPAEQIAYGRQMDREALERAKGPVKSLDTQSEPVLDQVVSPNATGVEMAGQVVDTAKYKYDRVKVRGPDGVARYTAGNKDAIAKSLLGMTKQQLFEASKANGLDLANHFKLRNDGHFRMIVGQALRSIINKGGEVQLRGVQILSLTQKVQWPEGYSEEKKGTTQNPIRKASPSVARIKD